MVRGRASLLLVTLLLMTVAMAAMEKDGVGGGTGKGKGVVIFRRRPRTATALDPMEEALSEEEGDSESTLDLPLGGEEESSDWNGASEDLNEAEEKAQGPHSTSKEEEGTQGMAQVTGKRPPMGTFVKI